MAKPTSKVGFVILFGARMKVFFIGDSKELEQKVSFSLRVRWPDFSLVHTAEGREVISRVRTEQPDICILDLDSPNFAGLDLLSQIHRFSSVPIIVLSQRNDIVDRARALEMGADDYITQPFIPMELIARVNALLRRSSIVKSEYAKPFVSGKLTINYATHRVFLSGKPVKLTPIEYKILCHLARSKGSVVTRSDLLLSVWGPDYQADPEFLKKYIYRLRSKVEDDHDNPEIIITEWGVGYKLSPSSAPTG